MNNLEDLMLYKQYLELIYYIEDITQKYPKSEKLALVSSIKNNTYEGMKMIIYAQKTKDKKIRLNYLNLLDVNLKMLKVLFRVSHRNKYINYKNLGSFSRKTTNIGNLLGAYIKSCQKQ